MKKIHPLVILLLFCSFYGFGQCIPTITPSGPITFCQGDNVTLTASVGNTYLWSTGATTSSIIVSTSGSYTVTVTDASSCTDTSAPITITINPQPNAGTSGNTTVCDSSTAAINLFGLISGEDVGGTWTRTTGTGGTFNAGAGTFTPAAGASSSTFTYTVTGIAPCVDDSSVATININPQPDAGTSSTTTVCDSNIAAINLFGLISGEDLGGTWVRNTGTGGTFNAGAGTFTPAAGAISSTFTYTIIGIATCVNDASVATININPQPNAGTSGNTTVCDSNTTPISLFGLISGEDLGGTWIRTTGTGGTFNAGAGTFAPAAGASSSTFTYTIIGIAPCVNDSSVATVNINPQPNAGTSGNTTVCDSNTTPINLFGLITGEDLGGTWTRTTGTGGTFNAGAGTFAPAAGASSSTFTYTIIGIAPCVNDASVATITINPQPNAGTSGNTTVCDSNTTPINLFGLISGENVGGTWTRTNGTGGTFNAGAGTFAPAAGATSSTFTYTIIGIAPCVNDSSVATVNITTLPTASISYAAPFCRSLTTAQGITLTGTGAYTGGTYSSTAGLSINPVTGAITPNVSSAGTYTVTYTTPASGGCSAVPITTSVTITAVPTASISYSGTPFCKSVVGARAVTLSGTGAFTGGFYSSTTGLSISSITGAITPSTSAAGVYTVTYTIPASGGCSEVSVTTSVTITAVPTATISYASTSFCKSITTAQNVTLTGTGAYTGGTFSSSHSSLTIDASSGAITPSTSNIRTYIVTYTIPASAGCSAVSFNTTVDIIATPTATISYTSTSFCKSVATPQVATLTGSGSYTGGIYSSTAGLTIDATTGAITPSSSTAGTYIVTYTIPSSAGCSAVSVTKSITITAVPTATINYTGIPFCKSVVAAQVVTLAGTGAYTGGVYSSTAGLSISPTTGSITPSASVAGIYTVTYTIPASGGCSAVPVTTSVTITAVPTAIISYSGTPFCKSVVAVQGVTLSGTGAYTGGVYSSTAGLTIDATTGAITPSSSNAGTYAVTYTIPASAGCSPVAVITSITITAVPTAAISYASAPFCKSTATAQTVTLTGTGAYTGGSYSSTAGLIINSITGAITPSTSTAGTYIVTYTTPTSAGCSAVTVTTSVTINAQPNAGTDGNTTICDSSPTVINLFNLITGEQPGGVWTQTSGSGGTFNTAGTFTPAAGATSSTFLYTLTGTAPCINDTSVATITINPQPNAGTDGNTTVCNSSSTAINLFDLITGEGTGGVWIRTSGTGGTLVAGTGTFTPEPTAISSTFTYTLAGTAPCINDSSVATIIIITQPNAGTDGNITVCDNSSTAINLSGLITGEQVGGTWTRTSGTGGTFVASTGTYTPAIGATSSEFTYTVTGTAPCINDTSLATVIHKPTPSATATPASQTMCSETQLLAVALSSNVTSTTISWTRNNIINVTGIAASGNGDISGYLTNNTISAQTVTFTITPTADGCIGAPITATVVVEAVPVEGAVTFSNLPGGLNVTTGCQLASGTLYLSGNTGIVNRWEKSITGGASWSPIAGTNGITQYNYSGLTQTTKFRVVLTNGLLSCPVVYSDAAEVIVIPNIKPSPVKASPPTICNGDSSILSSTSGYATSQNLASGGAFNTANPEGWLVDGCGNCLPAGNSNTDPGPFKESATNGGTYSGINYVSIGKFAIVHGALDSKLETPIFNTFGLTNPELNFDHAFNLLVGAWVKIELSFDGGLSYNTTLAQYSGASTRTPYNAFTPEPAINLSPYLNQANLRIRFNYHGVGASSWAVDNIRIPEAPAGTIATQWIDSVTGTVISNTSNATVSPTVTTTYAVTSFLNGCTSFGPLGTVYVTVNVNQRPTANIGVNQTICYNGTANFSIALTGVGPWTITYTDGTTPTTVSTSTNPYTFNVSNMTTTKTYTVTALIDSRCTAKPEDFTGSAMVTVLNGTPGLWTGLISTDWFDCRNWAGGLPSSTIDAQIPTIPSGNSLNMPVIDPANSTFAAAYSNIASAQDLIIGSGASASMATIGVSDLEISRNWINSGNFTPGIGTVTFKGTTTNQVQTINEGIKAQEGFYNLTLNNSNGAKGISVANAFELTVLNNLSLLSGDLRLTGEAQLVQAGIAANTNGGTGKLLRDQQGTKSSFNYDYWSSPVSADNLNYSIASILRDGTDVSTYPFNPNTINFGNGVYFADGAYTADGTASNPIRISNSWIYKYAASTNSYFSWQAVGSAGTIKVGEGYTMKGTNGTASFLTLQNYVFAGKPNNGNISLNIGPNQSYLIGNPYPSALNADEFIKNNIKDGLGNATLNAFNGALYFWDHFGGQTHFLAQYVGGYATYTLMGGVVAIANSPLNINDGSAGLKIPGKYIAVGQGFFIQSFLDPALITNNPNLSTAVTGGPIAFKNSQRAFKVESVSNSVFYRTENNTTSASADNDYRPKIRLKFDSPSGLHRQILVGADSSTTNLFDIGYDAPIADINGEDMYWEFSNCKFVIQAVPDFNVGQIIPLGLNVTSIGISTIKIDALENVPENTEIFLHDNLTGIYHDIKNSDFTISLPVGAYNNRFSLRFANQALNVDDNNLNNGISVFFTNSNNVLNIKNNSIDTTVSAVYLFNILGQPISNWDVENEAQQNIQIPVKSLSAGTYIAKVKTTKGNISKKIIIK
ncbi:PKD-like domain-containing protein [Flavobacterium sp.]|uniref:PKD-like domain-containing protein n=1 Tax=Flavobacterium sp. TaxID=239 RepID=UPI002B4AEF07|nr:PKD-like domain-containing protein [Flavobacterium sp.]HLF51901.1 PKD-like domain-containing protein [Flavobacterium sp.]